MPTIGIVVALPAEAKSITRQTLNVESLTVLSGDVWIAVSGAGPALASAAASRLVSHNADALISWGCAAALDGRLTPGSLVIPEFVIGATGDSEGVDHAWHQRISASLPRNLKTFSGSIRESGEIVVTRTEKTSLFQQSGAIAVDMESGAVGRVARHHRLPFLAIRAIADPADFNFPTAVSRSLDPRGQICITDLLVNIMRKPGQIPDLISLGRSFSNAMKTLSQVNQSVGPDFCFSKPRPAR